MTKCIYLICTNLRKDFVINRLEMYCVRIRLEIALKCITKISHREDSAMTLYFDCLLKNRNLRCSRLSYSNARATLDIYIYNSFYKISP